MERLTRVVVLHGIYPPGTTKNSTTSFDEKEGYQITLRDDGLVEVAKLVGEDATGKNKMRVRTLVHSSRCQMDLPPAPLEDDIKQEPIAEARPKAKGAAQKAEVV